MNLFLPVGRTVYFPAQDVKIKPFGSDGFSQALGKVVLPDPGAPTIITSTCRRMVFSGVGD